MFLGKKRRGPEKNHGPAKKRKMSPGKPPRTDRSHTSPKRSGKERQQQQRDKAGKGWKKFGDGEKTFGKRKTFGGKKSGDGEKKFGGKKKFGAVRDKGNSFKPKGQKAKVDFKKKGSGAKKGFKQRKGKG